MTAAVFVPNGADPRNIKRFRGFRRAGIEPIGFAFRRDRFNRDFVPDWKMVDLGTVADRRYGRRLASLADALRRVLRERATLRAAGLFYAINLDLAVIALLARRATGSRAPLVYETGDIPPLFMSRGAAGRAVRALERWVLRHADLLVVTSPAFLRHYFEAVQHYRGRAFVLENKPSASELGAARARAADAAQQRRPGPPWRVGWFGALRCETSWRLMLALADALPERVHFDLRGYPTRIARDEFEREIARRPNMTYGGEYRAPDDLPAIYGDVDVVWGFEFMDQSYNSRWLLPNRLYEGGAFGVPLLAAEGYETGRVVRELGIGWTFEEPVLDSLRAFFERLEPAEYARVRAAFDAVPAERFASDDDFSRCLDAALARESI